MCKKLIVLGVVMLCVGVSNATIVTSSTNFDGPTLDSPWQVGSGLPNFNGAGQLVIQPEVGTTENIWSTVGQGDFTATLDFKNLSYSDTWGGKYLEWAWSIENGDNAVYFKIGYSWNQMLYQVAYLKGDGSAWVTEADWSGMSAANYGTLQIAWDEATKTYTLSKGIDGAAVTTWKTISGFTASAPLRSQAFSATAWSAGDLISVGLDSYSIVPEPATMAILGLGGLLLRKRLV